MLAILFGPLLFHFYQVHVSSSSKVSLDPPTVSGSEASRQHGPQPPPEERLMNIRNSILAAAAAEQQNPRISSPRPPSNRYAVKVGEGGGAGSPTDSPLLTPSVFRTMRTIRALVSSLPYAIRSKIERQLGNEMNPLSAYSRDSVFPASPPAPVAEYAMPPHRDYAVALAAAQSADLESLHPSALSLAVSSASSAIPILPLLQLIDTLSTNTRASPCPHPDPHSEEKSSTSHSAAGLIKRTSFSSAVVRSPPIGSSSQGGAPAIGIGDEALKLEHFAPFAAAPMTTGLASPFPTQNLVTDAARKSTSSAASFSAAPLLSATPASQALVNQAAAAFRSSSSSGPQNRLFIAVNDVPVSFPAPATSLLSHSPHSPSSHDAIFSSIHRSSGDPFSPLYVLLRSPTSVQAVERSETSSSMHVSVRDLPMPSLPVPAPVPHSAPDDPNLSYDSESCVSSASGNASL